MCVLAFSQVNPLDSLSYCLRMHSQRTVHLGETPGIRGIKNIAGISLPTAGIPSPPLILTPQWVCPPKVPQNLLK